MFCRGIDPLRDFCSQRRTSGGLENVARVAPAAQPGICPLSGGQHLSVCCRGSQADSDFAVRRRCRTWENMGGAGSRTVPVPGVEFLLQFFFGLSSVVRMLMMCGAQWCVFSRFEGGGAEACLVVWWSVRETVVVLRRPGPRKGFLRLQVQEHEGDGLHIFIQGSSEERQGHLR